MRQLTARFVESLKTDKHREEIRDHAVEGLELRVTRSGTKTWCLRYRRTRDGRKCVLTIGRYPDFSLLEARHAAADARREIARGGDPAGEKQEHRKTETFADLATNWLSEHCEIKKRPGSVQNDRSILKRHLLPRFPEPSPRTRVLSDIELKKFWFGLESAPIRSADRTLLRFAAVTAQRIGEVASLSKRELDLQALTPVWIIPAARTKNKVPHKVWLSDLAVKLIREAEALSGASDWLFPLANKDLPMRTAHVADIMKVVRPALGIDDFVPHDLRRTAATYLGEHDVPDRDIEGVLNHVSGRGVTRKHYDHAVRERGKRHAMLLWSAYLENVVSVSRPVATEHAIAHQDTTCRVEASLEATLHLQQLPGNRHNSQV